MVDQAAGRLLPGRSRSEGKSLEPSERARWPGVGAVAGAGGAFLETLAKYSQWIGAFLEMRR